MPLSDHNHSLQSHLSRTIFLVEDDIDDQEFLEDAIRSLDPAITLTSFTSSVKFLEKLEKTEDESLPCLIVLDFNIPEINGAELLKKLKESSRYTAINKIIWSTSNSSLYMKTCMDLGAKDYLIKPSSVAGIQEIAATLLNWCRK